MNYSSHAIVTGGGSGIGAAIATRLHAEGLKITLMGRTASKLEAQAAKLAGANIQIVDVCLEDSVKEAFAAATTQNGPVNILVNCAGQAVSSPAIKTDLKLWQQMLDVNLTGTWLCIQAALPDLLAQGNNGRIINVASTAGLVGYPYVAAYTAAKHGVIGLTRALALELARKEITVNALCPGYTETEMLQETLQNIVQKTGRSETEAKNELTKHNPQGTLINPKQVAEAAWWLCQPASSAITGQAIPIAGGEVMAG